MTPRAPGSGAGGFGPYHLLRRLALGGMAEVYQAQVRAPGAADGLALGDLVAVKRLLPHVAEDEELRAMFLAEARIALAADHPQVIRAHALERLPPAPGEAEGEPYLVMEYVPGHTAMEAMAAQLGRSEGAPAEVICALGLRAAESLTHVHGLRDADGRRLDVVHRDVSPHNLMITPEGAVKLLDFGIAKFSGRSVETRVGVLKGKQAYMSPEQVARGPLDGRSDLFSLGVILWELATGERLFRGETLHDTLERVVAARVPPLSERAPALPPAVAELIMRCLAQRADDRPPSARAVAESLSAWLAEAGVGAPEHVLAGWFARLFPDYAEPPVAHDLASYHASLESAELRGEETTDQREIGDATGVFLADVASFPGLGQAAPPSPTERSAGPQEHRRRRLRAALTWATALVVVAFTLASTVWFVRYILS